MAIVGSLFALAGRLAGRLLNSALGWATILLFGKVEGRKQTIMLLIALGSLAWVVTLVGILLPDVGTFLLAFVPRPDFIPEWVVRAVMIGLALAIPLLVGVAAVYVTEPGSRPKGAGLVKSVLRGYPFTLILAVTIAVLLGVSIIRQARNLVRRWEGAHVPLIVKPGGYDEVVEDLRDVLDRAGLPVSPGAAPMVLSLPPKLLDAVAGKALGALVPDRLMLLRDRDLEVLVYPSDIAISGTKRAVARSRAAIASTLTGSPVYLTASAESEKVEDAIRRLIDDRGTDADRAAGHLRELDARIARLEVPFDEWETVYRERLQLERDLLRRSKRRDGPKAVASVAGADLEAGEPAALRDRALGLTVVALVLLDVALLVAERVRPPRPKPEGAGSGPLAGLTLGRGDRRRPGLGWWR